MTLFRQDRFLFSLSYVLLFWSPLSTSSVLLSSSLILRFLIDLRGLSATQAARINVTTRDLQLSPYLRLLFIHFLSWAPVSPVFFRRVAKRRSTRCDGRFMPGPANTASSAPVVADLDSKPGFFCSINHGALTATLVEEGGYRCACRTYTANIPLGLVSVAFLCRLPGSDGITKAQAASSSFAARLNWVGFPCYPYLGRASMSLAPRSWLRFP